MAKVSKSKKKGRPKNKKKTSRKTPRRPIFPALFFLLAICSLIAGFYLYTQFNLKTFQTHKPAITKAEKLANHKQNEPIKLTPSPEQPLSSNPVSKTTTLNYYRLDQYFNQAQQHRQRYEQKLTKQQSALKILHLLTFSRKEDLAPLPHGTKLITATFTPPVITIDLSRDLTKGCVNFGGQDEMLAISCLTNSFLLNFPDFESLQILIEGQKKETLAGHIDISKPLHFQTSIND